MGNDFYINPQTGGYDGTIITDLSNAAYLRATTPYGSYWADPTFGNRIYSIVGKKGTPGIELLGVQYTEQALQPLIDSGRATSVVVTAAQVQVDNDLRLNISVEIFQAGQPAGLFSFFVKVG